MAREDSTEREWDEGLESLERTDTMASEGTPIEEHLSHRLTADHYTYSENMVWMKVTNGLP